MKKINEKIFYFCNDSERAVGIENYFTDYHIICIDYNETVDYMINDGVKVFSLEKERGEFNPIFRSTYKLMQDDLALDYVKKNISKGEIPNIIVFKPSKKIEKLVDKYGWKLLNPDSSYNRKYERKISQYRLLSKEDKSIFPKSVVDRLESLGYEELVKKLGERFVIQYNIGHTGSSTVYIDNKEDFDLEQGKSGKKIARIAEYIEGRAWTLNAVVTRFGTFYGGLSYQITGIKECTSGSGATVGNDWGLSSLLSEKQISEIERIVKIVSDKLHSEGYRGMFGFDFVESKSDGRIYLIEVNMRQPASTSMHTYILKSLNLPSLLLFHILEFLYSDDKLYLEQLSKMISRN
ncbi:MAG TPA: ATP-grasp domain-containing protein, partial [bacterium]|nr:ATP-grasp domain-containing protein [bacterium]